jgi:hypothetical protein
MCLIFSFGKVRFKESLLHELFRFILGDELKTFISVMSKEHDDGSLDYVLLSENSGDIHLNDQVIDCVLQTKIWHALFL